MSLDLRVIANLLFHFIPHVPAGAEAAAPAGDPSRGGFVLNSQRHDHDNRSQVVDRNATAIGREAVQKRISLSVISHHLLNPHSFQPHAGTPSNSIQNVATDLDLPTHTIKNLHLVSPSINTTPELVDLIQNPNTP